MHTMDFYVEISSASAFTLEKNIPFECGDYALGRWMKLSQESVVNLYALSLPFSDKLIFLQ